MTTTVLVALITSGFMLVGGALTAFVAFRRLGRVEERSVVREEYEGMVDRLTTEIERIARAEEAARKATAECERFNRQLVSILAKHGIEVPEWKL